MSSKYLHEIRSVKCIDSVEVYDLSANLDSFTDVVKERSVKTKIKKVDVYRFLYKVKDMKVVGYLALPKKAQGKLPCIIHLRGGTGDFGMLSPRAIYGQLVKYAHEGYVVISTQYPGVENGSGVDRFGSKDDILSITKLRDILKGISIADIESLGVKGHSRGGLMTYMLLREVRWLKVAISTGAPVDQIKHAKERSKWREHQIRLWGKSKEELLRRSPLYWADELPKKVPILVMHGSADWRVPAQHGIKMSQAMYTYHIPHRFILFEGADHGITEYRGEYFRQSIEWLNRFLKGNEPLPNLKPHGE